MTTQLLKNAELDAVRKSQMDDCISRSYTAMYKGAIAGGCLALATHFLTKKFVPSFYRWNWRPRMVIYSGMFYGIAHYESHRELLDCNREYGLTNNRRPREAAVKSSE